MRGQVKQQVVEKNKEQMMEEVQEQEVEVRREDRNAVMTKVGEQTSKVGLN